MSNGKKKSGMCSGTKVMNKQRLLTSLSSNTHVYGFHIKMVKSVWRIFWLGVTEKLIKIDCPQDTEANVIVPVTLQKVQREGDLKLVSLDLVRFADPETTGTKIANNHPVKGAKIPPNSNIQIPHEFVGVGGLAMGRGV